MQIQNKIVALMHAHERTGGRGGGSSGGSGGGRALIPDAVAISPNRRVAFHSKMELYRTEPDLTSASWKPYPITGFVVLDLRVWMCSNHR